MGPERSGTMSRTPVRRTSFRRIVLRSSSDCICDLRTHSRLRLTGSSNSRSACLLQPDADFSNRALCFFMKRLVLLLFSCFSFVLPGQAFFIFERGADWRWHPGTNEASSPIEAWRQLDFVDSQFTTAPSPF